MGVGGVVSAAPQHRKAFIAELKAFPELQILLIKLLAQTASGGRTKKKKETFSNANCLHIIRFSGHRWVSSDQTAVMHIRTGGSRPVALHCNSSSAETQEVEPETWRKDAASKDMRFFRNKKRKKKIGEKYKKKAFYVCCILQNIS